MVSVTSNMSDIECCITNRQFLQSREGPRAIASRRKISRAAKLVFLKASESIRVVVAC